MQRRKELRAADVMEFLRQSPFATEAEVASALGVPREDLHRRLQDWGISIRSPGP